MAIKDTFQERVRFPIPDRELERRWKLVRQEMKNQGIDILLMQNDNQFLGGYVRYFIDIPVEQAYPASVLFPVDDEIVYIASASSKNPLPPLWASRGIGKRIGAPYFRSMYYTNEFDAAEMVKVIKDRKDKKVGIVALGMINAALYKHLQENLPGVELVDATDLVDTIKAVKSEDELIYVRKSMQIHDDLLSMMPSIIKPGVYEYEIRSEMHRLMTNWGSEEQWVMMGSAPGGTRTPHLHTFFQNRKLEEGDDILLMIEDSGPGGYYSEIVRTFCMREPSKELLELWDKALKVENFIVNQLKPGAMPADILLKSNNYIVELGFPPEERLLGHGQGYDLVERPALSALDTMPLKKNMVMAVHPTLANDKAIGFCCNNYLITDDGAVRLHSTPQEILRI